MTFFSHRRIVVSSHDLFLLIICCVITPLLLFPSLTELWSSALEKYMWWSAVLKKIEVAEQRSSAPYFDHCRWCASNLNFTFDVVQYTTIH